MLKLRVSGAIPLHPIRRHNVNFNFLNAFITKLDKEKNQCIKGKKNRNTEHSKGNKRVPGKVATTRTEDGHKWNTKTSTTM